MGYEIKQDFIQGLPKAPYRNGEGVYEGVCLHNTCTGGNDSDEKETIYFKREWKNRSAFVHFFTDADSITQHADINYKSWGCGNGNSRFVNIELCDEDTLNDFNESYKRWVWLAAKVLFDRKLGVIDGKTIVSHDWVSKNLGGTSHTDPHGYLAKWGKKWSDVVADVKKQYDVMAAPKPVAPKLSVSANGLYRVRKAWTDEKSQVGAYSDLDNAIDIAKAHAGYKVYDEKGNQLYPKPVSGNVGKLVVVDYEGSEGINIREKADFTSKVVAVVHKGQAFQILEELPNHFRIGSGYITKSKEYVHVK